MSEHTDNKKRLKMLLVAVMFFGMVGGLYETTFNNYLADIFDIGTEQRGAIEFPREMPGFLVTLVVGSLAALALNRVGFVAMSLAAVGLVGLAFAPGHYGMMIVFMVIFSTGAHLNMPVQESITLSLAKEGKQATRLGQVGAAAIMGTIVGAGFVALAMGKGWVSFKGTYLIAACCAVAGAAVILTMGRVERHNQARRKVFVFKRRYSLYYGLCALYGVRKQVFMTFGPWVLIRIFDQRAQMIAVLWVAYSVVGIFLRPFVGRLIDKWGERRLLVSEGLILAVVCVTYAVAGTMPELKTALYAVMGAYVVDQMCFAVTMARTTYLAKILERPEDISGGLFGGNQHRPHDVDGGAVSWRDALGEAWLLLGVYRGDAGGFDIERIEPGSEGAQA